MSEESSTFRPGGDVGGDVAAMLERAAAALTDVAEGTDKAIADLRAELGRRQVAPSPVGDEERELLEAVLARTEAARTETLGLVGVMRRARAELAVSSEREAAEQGSRLDLGRIAARNTEGGDNAGRPAVAAAPVPQAPATPEFSAAAAAAPDTVETALPDAADDLPEVPDDREDTDVNDASDGSGEGALLLATQMAVAGSSRDDIERCLAEFGVRDTRSVLERVFGY